MSLSISYKGAAIGEYDVSDCSHAFDTKGMFCEDDIAITSNLYPLASDLEQYIVEKSGMCGNVAYVGTALNFSTDRITLRVFFTGALANYSYTYVDVDGVEKQMTTATTGSYRYANLEGIQANYIPHKYTIKVSDGQNVYTVVCSVMAYVRSMLLSATSKKELKDFVAAIYYYGLTAERALGG